MVLLVVFYLTEVIAVLLLYSVCHCTPLLPCDSVKYVHLTLLSCDLRVTLFS